MKILAVKQASLTTSRYITRNLYSLNSKMSLEKAKQFAAIKAVDEHVYDNFVVGLGSGSTVIYAAQRLAERVQEDQLNIVCIPTSFQARQLIIKHKLVIGDLETNPVIDVTIDGADEVDDDLTLIKGGGGCLLQEKIIASCSKQMIVIADYTKDSKSLGEKYRKGIPIEVVPMAYVPIMNKILDSYGGEIKLRQGVSKAGPCVTDNGNFILDWVFDSNKKYNWPDIDSALKMIPGVIETGLFINMCYEALFGQPEGNVTKKIK